ncbi:late embryogenesis abundant protein Lea14-A [Canna indica]|uniref:Late embryogenesis abundant protein Lea14-A n=1 Tax=Canna indica TaxID=4628 RepID=A0AAQ3JZY3_9LILI|nr:late embryogenesis abundant protein Lea14-A [Canna indica]
MSRHLLFVLVFSLALPFALSRDLTKVDQTQIRSDDAEKLSFPKPEVKISKVYIKKISLTSVTFQVDLSVHNPYPLPIPVPEISYDFTTANKTIVSGTIPDPGSLTANGDTKLEVPMTVSYSFLIDLLKDIVKDWDIDYMLKVGFIVDLPVVGKFTIPITIKDSIKLPHLN